MALFVPALLLLLSVPLVVAMMRSNELFLLRVRGDQLVRVRGRIPQRLFDDLAGIVGRAGLSDVELRCIIEDGRPRLYGGGEDEVPRPVRQQFRNAIGQWQVAAIRQAPKLRASKLTSDRG